LNIAAFTQFYRTRASMGPSTSKQECLKIQCKQQEIVMSHMYTERLFQTAGSEQLKARAQ